MPLQRSGRDTVSEAHLYVAYGANVDPEGFAVRCPSSEPAGEGLLRGWRLALAGHSRLWHGPVATVIPGRPDDAVPVALYRMSPADWRGLDRIEGHPRVYRRARLPVQRASGEEVRGLAYLLPAEVSEVAPAEPQAYAYAWSIRRGYAARGWDPAPLDRALRPPPRIRPPRAHAPHPPPTEHLRFERWTDDDAGLARSLWGNPAVTEKISARGVLGPEEVDARLAAEQAEQVRHGVQYWPLFLRSGMFLGAAGLHARRDGVDELGVHLLPEAWGRGLAAEACRAVIRFAFEERGCDALFAGHHPDNAPSQRLLQRLGFTWTHDEYFPPTRALHPSYRLSPG